MSKSNPLIPLGLVAAGFLLVGGKKKKKHKALPRMEAEDAEQRVRNVEALPESYFEADAKEDPGDRVIPEMLAAGRSDDSTLGP